jgi:hypothetical protein
MLQPPLTVIATGSPELEIAVTGNVAPMPAAGGGADVTVIVWLTLVAAVLLVTCEAAR